MRKKEQYSETDQQNVKGKKKYSGSGFKVVVVKVIKETETKLEMFLLGEFFSHFR